MKKYLSWSCFIAALHLIIFWSICGAQNLHTLSDGEIVFIANASTFWQALIGEHSWIHGLLLIIDLTILGIVVHPKN